MTKDLSKKIIDDLEKVGFPTEVVISSKLDHTKWTVYNGALFEDIETRKDREIDIHAVKVDYYFAGAISQPVKQGDENKLIAHLVIEIKKTDKPWIFFDNGRTSWPQIPSQNFKSLRNKFHNLLFDDLKKLGLKKHRYINEILHKSYHISFSNPSITSAIYEALVKVSKALDYFKSHYGNGRYSLHLFIPIVVLDGSLWSASLNKSEKVELKSTNHLFVVFTRLTKNKESEMSFEEEQICDIVTREGFNDYLQTLQKDNREVYKAWTNFNVIRIKKS